MLSLLGNRLRTLCSTKYNHIHFVGIGGIGMSGIAEILLSMGYKISGSDKQLSSITDRLKELGATIFNGHAAHNIEGARVVVTSTAISLDNPEVCAAKEAGIQVIPRAEMLAELMRFKYGIAVAGAHGKTTTTSMVASILDHAHLDPTIIVGGRVNTFGSNARRGQSGFMVVEADESDKSFLKLSPSMVLVTNIDLEHLEHYRDLEDIQSCFLQFMNSVPFFGSVIACSDDVNIQRLLPKVTKNVITYGLQSGATISAKNIEINAQQFSSSFIATRGSEILGEITLAVPGIHNVTNSLAAIAAGLELEISFEAIRHGLESFGGVERRFQIKGIIENEGLPITVVDDYGHHPTEIRATLAAAKASGRRIVVLFQPHRYTRTAALHEEFSTCFHDADVALLIDIYPASEQPIPGVTSERLARAINEAGHKDVSYVGTIEEACRTLEKIVKPGDIVLTLGAGNIYQAGDQFLKSSDSHDFPTFSSAA